MKTQTLSLLLSLALVGLAGCNSGFDEKLQSVPGTKTTSGLAPKIDFSIHPRTRKGDGASNKMFACLSLPGSSILKTARTIGGHNEARDVASEALQAIGAPSGNILRDGRQRLKVRPFQPSVVAGLWIGGTITFTETISGPVVEGGIDPKFSAYTQTDEGFTRREDSGSIQRVYKAFENAVFKVLSTRYSCSDQR